MYRQVSNIRRILVGNKIVDNSDVVGASPVGFGVSYIRDLTVCLIAQPAAPRIARLSAAIVLIM